MSVDNSISAMARKLLSDVFFHLERTEGRWYELLNTTYFSSPLTEALSISKSDFDFVLKSAGFLRSYGAQV